MVPPKLSTPCCAKPLQRIPAVIPCSKSRATPRFHPKGNPRTRRPHESRTPPRKTPRRRLASPRCPQALRLSGSTTCWRDHLRGRSSWRKRTRLREPREKIHPLSLPRRILLRPPTHVSHVCRIQAHRSRARHRDGFERTLDHIFGVF